MSEEKTKAPVAPVAAAQVKPDRKVEPMPESRMALEESRVLHYHFIAPAGILPSDLVDPAHWAHLAHKFQEYTKLEVYAEDWTWRVLLVVRSAGQNWARVEALELNKFDERSVDEGSNYILAGYAIKHAGSFAKWRVIREADGAVIRDKFPTKADAEAWLVEHAKNQAA